MVDAALARDAEDVVVDVGDVAHAVDGVPPGMEAPGDDIEDVVGEGVPQVGCVIRSDTADVERDGIARWLEGLEGGGGGGEEQHRAALVSVAGGGPSIAVD